MHADAALFHLDHVDQQTGTKPGRKPPGDLLAVGGSGQQYSGRSRRLDQRGQHVDHGSDQVFIGGIGLGDVDLGGARLLQRVQQGRGRPRGTDHDGGGFAQRAGGGDQFGADLLHCAFSVLDEYQCFSHGLYRSSQSGDWSGMVGQLV